MAEFEASVTLFCPHEAVFDFLIRPANVARISLPEMGVRLLDVPELLELGSRVEFEVTGYGPIQRLIHEITEFDHPNQFTETQLQGPLKSFVHQHIVESDGDRVLVIDRIEFEPPGGLVGFLVTEERILQSLTRGFDHRHRELKKLLEQPLE